MTQPGAPLLTPTVSFTATGPVSTAARATWVDETFIPCLRIVERNPALSVTLALPTETLEWLIEKDFHGAFRLLADLHHAGRVDLLLLDSDIRENRPEDRTIAYRAISQRCRIPGTEVLGKTSSAPSTATRDRSSSHSSR